MQLHEAFSGSYRLAQQVARAITYFLQATTPRIRSLGEARSFAVAVWAAIACAVADMKNSNSDPQLLREEAEQARQLLTRVTFTSLAKLLETHISRCLDLANHIVKARRRQGNDL